MNNGFCPDMVEFHASISDKKQIIADFEDILSMFQGDISVCINRKLFPINETIELLSRMKK